MELYLELELELEDCLSHYHELRCSWVAPPKKSEEMRPHETIPIDRGQPSYRKKLLREATI